MALLIYINVVAFISKYYKPNSSNWCNTPTELKSTNLINQIIILKVVNIKYVCREHII